MDKQKVSLSSIFSRVDVEKEKLYQVISGWNFLTLESFILSFEKLSQTDNIHHSRKYGNIAKKITTEILDEDVGSIDLGTQTRYKDDEILKMVLEQRSLYKRFSLLYEEISKRNQWKLEMPVLSIRYDLFLDRYRNDYERFKVIYNLFKGGESIKVRDVEADTKIKLTYDKLKKHEKNEIEKIFYKLLNKIHHKKDGDHFLKKFSDIA